MLSPVKVWGKEAKNFPIQTGGASHTYCQANSFRLVRNHQRFHGAALAVTSDTWSLG